MDSQSGWASSAEAHFHSVYKQGRGMPKGHGSPLPCVGNPSPTQSSRRTGPSSPPPELLPARVDTGRGAVHSALRRSRDWIGWIGSRTTLHQGTSSIIHNWASSGNPRGLLPRLDLGSTRRKSFVYLHAPLHNQRNTKNIVLRSPSNTGLRTK